MIKKIFILTFFFFSLSKAISQPPAPVPLPTFPEKAKEIVAQKNMMEQHIKIYPIQWNMYWHSGIQQIKIIPFYSTSERITDMSEIIYDTNQYKGTIISMDIRPLFTIYSNLSIGFRKGFFPRDFSVDTIPYRNMDWTSLESDSYIAKKIPITNKITLAPYGGYMFSQYKLSSSQESILTTEKIYHSVVAGTKFIFQPTRLFFIEIGLSFSPLTAIDRKTLSMFQINYETLFTFTSKFITLSLILSTRNNIEYQTPDSEAATLQVSKTGFRFRFYL